jgi:hypothetical protein
MKVGIRRPSPATVIASIAVVIALTGTAIAAVAPKSVGTRHIKPRAVTTAKIANDAVNSEKVKKKTLVGSDFKISAFGVVPQVERSSSAVNANTVNGHSAACPGGTTLVRGTCYDSAPKGPILGIKAAADACANDGGLLPTPMEAQSIRQAVFLGDGTGANSVYTDSYHGNTVGDDFGMIVVNNNSTDFALNEDKVTKEIIGLFHYVCAYRLVR